MSDRQTFNPLGRLLSACLTLLVAAIVLSIAVDLIRRIWVWLVVIAGVVSTAVVIICLSTAWRRRQPW